MLKTRLRRRKKDMGRLGLTMKQFMLNKTSLGRLVATADGNGVMGSTVDDWWDKRASEPSYLRRLALGICAAVGSVEIESDADRLCGFWLEAGDNPWPDNPPPISTRNHLRARGRPKRTTTAPIPSYAPTPALDFARELAVCAAPLVIAPCPKNELLDALDGLTRTILVSNQCYEEQVEVINKVRWQSPYRVA